MLEIFKGAVIFGYLGEYVEGLGMTIRLKLNNVRFFSFQFPYCDGSHRKHNQFTGDNVGPLIVKKK